MKVIVCIKQVPDTSGKVAVNPDGTLNRASMQTITNPDDMNAVEAALKLKDETGCEVVVVTMGPPPAAGMLREAMAMGAAQTLGADVAVSVTGLAGPGGDEFGNPVGRVYIGYWDANGAISREFTFQGDREAVRQQAADAALNCILEKQKKRP